MDARAGTSAASLAGRLGPPPSGADYGVADFGSNVRANVSGAMDGRADYGAVDSGLENTRSAVDSTVGGPRRGTDAVSLANRPGPEPSPVNRGVTESSLRPCSD